MSMHCIMIFAAFAGSESGFGSLKVLVTDYAYLAKTPQYRTRIAYCVERLPYATRNTQYVSIINFDEFRIIDLQ